MSKGIAFEAGAVAGYLEDISGSLASIADRLESIEYHLKRYVDLEEFWKCTDPSMLPPRTRGRVPAPSPASTDAGEGSEK